MYTPNENELCTGACSGFYLQKNDRAHFSMYIDASCVHVTLAGDAVEGGEERGGAARANRLAAWGAGHIDDRRARPRRA